MGSFESVIFDLDGTLVDSLPGIEASARHAAESCLPERPLPPMKSLIGPPIAVMFARLWPDLAPEGLKELVSAFRRHYDAEGCLLSKPYPGVVETLDSLHRRGLRFFVLTNKPLGPTTSILRENGMLAFFTDVLSPDSVQPPFESKADGARLLRDRFRLDPSRTVLAGDGVDDGLAAAACGYAFVAAEYGYGGAATDGSLTKLAVLKRLPEIVAILHHDST